MNADKNGTIAAVDARNKSNMIEGLPEPGVTLEEFANAVDDFYHERKVYYKTHPDSKESDFEDMLASRGKEILQTYESLLPNLRGKK